MANRPACPDFSQGFGAWMWTFRQRSFPKKGLTAEPEGTTANHQPGKDFLNT
ncbi:MAG: hypothetical protein AAF978_09855 [Cyanobacteria bacterium P01_E01_bin.48]